MNGAARECLPSSNWSINLSRSDPYSSFYTISAETYSCGLEISNVFNLKLPIKHQVQGLLNLEKHIRESSFLIPLDSFSLHNSIFRN